MDGDSDKEESADRGIIKLPGDAPETEVFNYVRRKIDELSMRLAVAMHLSPDKEGMVKEIVQEVSMNNRDHHLLFSQVGAKAGLIPYAIVSSAFVSIWLDGNREQASAITEFIVRNLDAAGS